MPEFGNTVNQVKKQFAGTKIVPSTFSSNDRLEMAYFAGDYLQKLIKVLSEEKPDFILILGDRVEMLCSVLAAVYLKIPSGHLHGGEKTSTVDEITRHAITKLASLHFPATKKSAERIEKMGEERWRIHTVGAPSLDVILNEKLPTRTEVFQKIRLDPDKKIILVLQHPAGGPPSDAGKQMKETLSAVKSFNLPVVVIFPNADPGGRKVIEVIKKEGGNPLFRIIPSLEYKDFLALEKEASVIIGNSSFAMIEASSFKIPVVNIGDRQKGRERGENVINVEYSKEEIRSAVDKSLNDAIYLKKISKIINPWGDGKTAPRIVKILESIKLNKKLLDKQLTY